MNPTTLNSSLRAVILDWAGTTIDHGCLAPTLAFVELFEAWNVPISLEQARRPMGIHKRDHIRRILEDQDVRERWQLAHGKGPTEEDVHSLFERFIPIQLDGLRKHSALIPGTVEAVAEFRRQGLKVGATTGYTAEMMRIVEPEAERNGYKPDFGIAADQVASSRPFPWMCLRVAEALNVFPPAVIVKVGDTVPDIQEGLNAGMWTVGVSVTGNEMGLTEAQLLSYDDAALAAKRKVAIEKLRAAGAHYVVDSIREVPRILDMITTRLQQGEKP